MKAGDDLDREIAEIVVLAAADGNQLVLRHAERPHHILRALGPDHCRMSLECDMRNIHDVVNVSVRHQDEIGLMNVRVNGGGIRFNDFVPVVDRSGIGGLPARRRGRGRADLNSRKIRINENHGLAVAYFPGGGAHVGASDLRFLRWRS